MARKQNILVYGGLEDQNARDCIFIFDFSYTTFAVFGETF